MKSTLGLLAVAAAGANAIMLPPTVALENINVDVGTTSLIDPYTNVLEVACPGCLYAQPHEGGFIWTKGVENSLLLNISVGSNPASLEFNGVQFYPPLMTFSSEPPIPTIAQIPASVSLSEVIAHPEQYTAHPLRLTSWSFYADSANTINDQGHEIISISLHLGAVEMLDINVPDLSIKALKDTEGNLIILRVEQTALLGSPLDKSQECTNWPLLCKLKAIVASKVSAWKTKMHHGCKHKGKGKGHGGKPATAHIEPAKEAGEDVGHHRHHQHADDKLNGKPLPEPSWHKHHHHHHHHHHHSKLHRVLRAIARVLLTVLVPVLVGVAAGMVLYLAGYVVGASLAFVVARVFGRRQQRRGAGYQAVALADDDESEPRASTEKAPFEDPPEYVEVEAVVVHKD